ncbi:LysM peptidoglycan-binding domain-containing protein [Halioxenophilus sp. WMMB6]|uniref:LysM peptidoglycan-binding domain-containing protein n=1 Tax=Halioxenophilus sp. WMMB6 TaxID=3073815 RepID=UPI00295EF646|nr:LysM peptidoglycan-binding domain-containing protein [Halioxenophilus sp. WMMB6]
MLKRKFLFTITLGGLTLLAGCSTQTASIAPTSSNSLASDSQYDNVNLGEVTNADHCDIVEYEDADFSLSDQVDLWERLRQGFALPDTDHERIQTYVDWYKKHPTYLDRVTERGTPYLQYIASQLEEQGLPLELALLPIVESAFDPFAYSHGRAAGMWQFVPGTAKAYGLKQNWWYDGRRDIVASTGAAIKYLSYLNSYFDGDWLAALAAYNSGEGTVSRAQKRNRKVGKSDDYWNLKLPKETAAYVPQLLALAKIIKNPEAYQITLAPLDNRPFFQEVPIGSQIDLAQAAELAEISIDELYKLNPGFNRWATDPTGPHQLLIPIEKASVFTENLSQLDAGKRVGWERYTIKNGDSLISIANHFDTDVTTLKTVNGLKGNFIRAGNALMIPVAMASDKEYSYSVDQRLLQRQSKRPGNESSLRKITYTTQNGDSFWKIARQHEVGVRELAKWNAMAPTDPLPVGKKLVVWLKPEKATSLASSANSSQSLVRKIHYQVRSGDSLARIASKFNLTVSQIQSWNSVARKKYLHPGDSLTLFVDVRNAN